MGRKVWSFLIVFLCAAVFTLPGGKGDPRGGVALPDRAPVFLRAKGRFDFKEIRESSALVRSRRHGSVFWTVNDSGNEPVIYPVTSRGKLISTNPAGQPGGIRIQNARNIDWEDLAADGKGSIIIGDSGNNSSSRNNLSLYIVREPDPRRASNISAFIKVPFHYPEQKWDKRKNFDAEGLFCDNNTVYLLTKHRDDTRTCLYRFDSLAAGPSRPLALIAAFDVQDMVTGADFSPGSGRLALLTYTAVWLFEKKGREGYFEGRIWWLPIFAGQCEGITFNGDELVLCNEAGNIYGIPLKNLILLRE